MNLLMRQERVFINKFGLAIYEDILHFSSCKNQNRNILSEARQLGMEILEDSRKRAPHESIDDLNDAINMIDNINYSPLLNKVALNKATIRSQNAQSAYNTWG
jgi:hypothetical protein